MSSVQGTTSTGSAANVNTSLAPQSASDIQNQFLKMLVAQLNNQDPLNPMDSAQITDQMAQISTVGGIQQLNTTLQSLTSQGNTAQQIEAAGLVGHSVLVDGSSIALTANGAAGGFSLGQSVDELTVSIKDANGNVVHTVDLGQQASGMHTFAWDGTTDNGLTAAQGSYTFSISATAAGKSVTAESLSLAAVNGIVPGTSGTTLDLGSQGTAQLSSVKQIF